MARHRKCSLCNQPIKRGDSVYTITGDHWDCHAAQARKFFDAIEESFKRLDDALRAFRDAYTRTPESSNSDR